MPPAGQFRFRQAQASSAVRPAAASKSVPGSGTGRRRSMARSPLKKFIPRPIPDCDVAEKALFVYGPVAEIRPSWPPTVSYYLHTISRCKQRRPSGRQPQRLPGGHGISHVPSRRGTRRTTDQFTDPISRRVPHSRCIRLGARRRNDNPARQRARGVILLGRAGRLVKTVSLLPDPCPLAPGS